MAIKAWVNQQFDGGEATDKKVGIDNAFANSQSLDFRKSPSQMSVLPGPRRADKGVVKDLLQNEVMTPSGRIYGIGSTGFVYTVSPAGVWSVFGNVPDGAFGINYRQDQDSIYITSSTVVSSITNVSTAPTLNPSFYADSQSTYDNTSQAGFNVNSNQSGGTQTTAILSTYAEGNLTQERFWQTDIQPVDKIGVYITVKGTGDWTLVVHDGLNNQLGTATVTNSSLIAGQVNYFVFSAPIEVNVGPNNAQTYHFHLTSTVADGTIKSTSSNDLSTADMELWANRLIATTNGIHPIVTFQQFECIGNGRYLSVWEPLGDPAPSNAEWLRQKLSFPPGYNCCGLEVFNEYLVIATEKVITGDGTPQDGIIFYWDGLADTYNYFTKIPEGSPQAIHEYENVVYYEAGGNWYAISSVAATPTKIRRLPGSENVYTQEDTQTRVNPYAATTRYGIQLMGWPSTTANQSLAYGVYSWGKVDYTFPNGFGYSYILSTGSQFKTDTNNLTIGMVKNFGNLMHISWRDGTVYGVDVVDASSDPANYAYWESLIFDNGYVTKQKTALYMDCSWLEFQDGVEIVLKYSINRGDWNYSPRYSNEVLYLDDTGYARFDIGTMQQEERFREIQIGVDIYCSDAVTLPPVIVSVGLVFDTNDAEALQ